MKKNTRHVLWETTKGVRTRIAIIYGATIAAAFLRYGLALAYQKTIDALPNVAHVFIWLGVGLGFTALWNIGNYVRMMNTVKSSEKIATAMRQKYLGKYFNTTMLESESLSTGELITKLIDDINLTARFFTYNVREIIFGIIQLGTGLFFAFNVSYYFGIVLIVSTLVCVLSNKMFSPLIQKQYSLQQAEEDALKTISEDRLKHQYVTDIFNAYEIHNDKFKQTLFERTKKIIKLENTAAFFSAFSNFSGYITIISLYITGIILLKNEMISMGSFISMFQVSSVVLWPFLFFPNIFKTIGQQKTAMNRLLSFEKLSQEEVAVIDADYKASTIIAEALDFNYTENKYVLKNFSYRAQAGELNCIAGESGTGKSTLAKLLLSLYEPKSGTIYFLDTNNKKHSICRSMISYVPQDCKLFTGTILENLLHAKPDASRAEIDEAVKKAGAYGFIEKRDAAYNSYIDNSNNSGISYGQKQRIAIARAILKKSQMIIFDEPTSALDAQTEADVIALLKELAKEKIVIVISHSKNIIAESHLRCVHRGSDCS